MKKSRFTRIQIIDALQRADVAPMVPELCRELVTCHRNFEPASAAWS